MRILLAGGTGGLGRALARAAEAAGHTVRIASRRARPHDAPAGREWARMDVETGEGLADALAGADAVIHAASDPRRHAAVDVAGTRRLMEAARAAGTPHLVYVSIVGIDQVPLAYYRAKLQAEGIVAGSGVPHSILRVTHFHSLVDGMLAGFARVPLMLPLPAGFRFQSVATAEAADRLMRAAEAGPGGRLPDFGGPQVLTLGEMARPWKEARGVRKPALPLPVPGALAAALRAGRNTLRDAEGERGTLRWADWLRASPAVTRRAALLGLVLLASGCNPFQRRARKRRTMRTQSTPSFPAPLSHPLRPLRCKGGRACARSHVRSAGSVRAGKKNVPRHRGAPGHVFSSASRAQGTSAQ